MSSTDPLWARWVKRTDGKKKKHFEWTRDKVKEVSRRSVNLEFVTRITSRMYL